MAKSKKYLSFSWPPERTEPLICRLMFADHCRQNILRISTPHIHDFWQLELVTGGAVILNADGISRKLTEGMAVLLPPQAEHGFEYPRRNAGWLSLKFCVSYLDNHGCGVTIWEKNDLIISPMLAILAELYRKADIPTTPLRMITESLLAGILSEVHAPKFQRPLHSIVRDVENYTGAHISEPIRIDELAKAIGYSANYLGVKFCEHAGMNLKSFIDAKRANHAKHLLEFTDKTIGQIAEAMGFDTIYAFSRFFKRVTGIAPSAMR
jgi:AraC-like DNA-binding protein